MNNDFFRDHEELMSLVSPLGDLIENERGSLQPVFFEENNATCMLRICKGRDLSAVYSVLSQTRHPGLPVIYAYSYDGENTYVLTEYLRGTNLGATKRIYTEDETARIIIEICRALHPLHNHRPPLIHNDIKPENIMLCDNNSIKLFDFDISRTYKEDRDQNTVLMGTKSHASPEHFGFAQTSPRSDIYSLGTTMYTLHTGKAFPKNCKNNRFPYKGGLKRIIQKCTFPDPASRYGSVATLERKLTRFLKRKRRILISVLILFSLLLLLAGGLWLHHLRKPPVTTPPPSGSTVETTSPSATQSNLTILRRLSGEMPCPMVAQKNGTVVWLERTESDCRLLTTTGVERSLPIEPTNDCYLIYNPHTDALYAVICSDYVTSLYAVDSSYTMATTPLYQAASAFVSQISGVFFSDGTLYCNAFSDNLISTDDWVALSKTNASVFALIEDIPYAVTYSGITTIDLQNNYGETYPSPVNTFTTSGASTDGQSIYLAGYQSDGKDYIYRFDGNSYSQVVCLNDYTYYTDWNSKFFCVTDDTVYLYDRQTATIKTVKI